MPLKDKFESKEGLLDLILAKKLFNPNLIHIYQGLFGGILTGLALGKGLTLIMPFGIAFLWPAASSFLGPFLWGSITFVISHNWIFALHPIDWIGIPSALSIPIVFFIFCFCAIISGGLVAVWGLILRVPVISEFKEGGLKEKVVCCCLMSALWGLGEVYLAKSPLFWIGIGANTLPGDVVLSGLAKWIGSGGLALIQLIIGFWLWNLYVFRKNIYTLNKIFLYGICSLLVLHLIGFLLLLNGYLSEKYPIAIWQTNVPIRQKFNYKNQLNIKETLIQSLNYARNSSANVLVTPEGTWLDQNGINTLPEVPLITGGFRTYNGTQRSSLLVFESNEKTYSKSIDKYRLVPLGEWIPQIFGFLNNGLSAVGGLNPGLPSRKLEWSGPPAAIAICYEISDGNSIAQAVDSGAEWILASSNLDPYPISLQNQYLLLARLRSIENSRSLVSVANTGPSGLISGSGSIERIFPPFQSEIDVVNVELISTKTIYTRYKETPLIMLLIGSIIILTFKHIGN